MASEENCAVMVVDQLRDFLEHGNVRHSVNFPETRMAHGGVARICVANQNRPNMIGQRKFNCSVPVQFWVRRSQRSGCCAKTGRSMQQCGA